MAHILKPNIVVDTIEFKKDENNQQGTDSLLNHLGKNVPVIKIGEFVLDLGAVLSFEIRWCLNSFPVFSMTLNDKQYHIRELLKSSIDTCVIFIGYSHWYIKFNGLLNTTYTDAGDSNIDLSGIVFDKKMFGTKQQVYADMSIVDMLKKICTDTGLGLNTDDNKQIHSGKYTHIAPNNRYINSIDSLIAQNTNNIYCIDWFYYLHVIHPDMQFQSKKKTAEYTLNTIDGKQLKPAPIIFKTMSLDVSDYSKFDSTTDSEEIDRKIPVKYYTINSNYTKQHLESGSEYSINNKVLQSDSSLGMGTVKSNTFSGFVDTKKDHYTAIVNKLMAGTIIKLVLDFIVIELIPFSMVELELYLPDDKERKQMLDTEHSGKKMLIGNLIRFERHGTDTVKFEQILELI